MSTPSLVSFAPSPPLSAVVPIATVRAVLTAENGAQRAQPDDEIFVRSAPISDPPNQAAARLLAFARP